MKKLVLATLILWASGLYAFDNLAELDAFDSIMKDKQTLQKAKSLCMQDKLWLGAKDNEAHFAEACYVVASVNLMQNSLIGSDDIELREDLDLMKKACAITLIKNDGCMGFMAMANMANMLKEKLNLSDDYVDESLKERGLKYLSGACEKEYSIFKGKAKNKKSINGFYNGNTCHSLVVAYLGGIGTSKDEAKADFYTKRSDEIRGAK